MATQPLYIMIISTILHLSSQVVHAGLTWSTSPTKLPRGDAFLTGAYSQQTDLLYVLGGYRNKRQMVSVDSTNVMSSSAATFTADTTTALSHDYSPDGHPYTQIGDILYMINTEGTGFSIFDLSLDVFTANYNNIVIPNAVANRACLAHIDEYLIITGGYNAPNFANRADVQIYDLKSGSWILSANDMSKSRGYHSCVVNPNTKYLYVMGGDETGSYSLMDTVSKLFIGDIVNVDRYGWIELSDKLGLKLYLADAAIYGNDIYVIGGAYKDGSWQASANVYHILPDDSVVLDSNIPEGDNHPTVILANHVLFVLGGFSPSYVYKDSIYYAELPSLNPTASPSEDPTLKPTNRPTVDPTLKPTNRPTLKPTNHPTLKPTLKPTKNPTKYPTKRPTMSPTMIPTKYPTKDPSLNPTGTPTQIPTTTPTKNPSVSPTQIPTTTPTKNPSISPTQIPTTTPTKKPSVSPTQIPTTTPTKNPSISPTQIPTTTPTNNPSVSPTQMPSTTPTNNPSSQSPTFIPTRSPSQSPTKSPSRSPTFNPSTSPSQSPTFNPTGSPSESPTSNPTMAPSQSPTFNPTSSPSQSPTESPTLNPTQYPSQSPTSNPTKSPSESPTFNPVTSPTRLPSANPTVTPTRSPTKIPTNMPTIRPTKKPTITPTHAPTASPFSERHVVIEMTYDTTVVVMNDDDGYVIHGGSKSGGDVEWQWSDILAIVFGCILFAILVAYVAKKYKKKSRAALPQEEGEWASHMDVEIMKLPVLPMSNHAQSIIPGADIDLPSEDEENSDQSSSENDNLYGGQVQFTRNGERSVLPENAFISNDTSAETEELFVKQTNDETQDGPTIMPTTYEEPEGNTTTS
eukprot:686623_1